MRGGDGSESEPLDLGMGRCPFFHLATSPGNSCVQCWGLGRSTLRAIPLKRCVTVERAGPDEPEEDADVKGAGGVPEGKSLAG